MTTNTVRSGRWSLIPVARGSARPRGARVAWARGAGPPGAAGDGVGRKVGREAAGTPDPRDEDGLLGDQLLAGEQPLDRGEHGAIAAPRTPARPGAPGLAARLPGRFGG